MLITKDKEKLKTSGIYKIVIKGTNLMYIGSSKTVISRFKWHLWDLNGGKHHNTKLQEFFNKGNTLELVLVEEVLELDKLWERELHYIYKNEAFITNETHTVSNRNNTAYFTKEEVHQIAELYNSGMTGTAISLKLYHTRDKRAVINRLIKGEALPNFKHLFNYREYTQEGNKRGLFSCSPKYRDLGYTEKLKSVEKDKKYIIDNLFKMSGRQIAKELNLNSRQVSNFLREYKKEKNIIFDKKFNQETIKNYKNSGHTTERYDENTVLIDKKHSVNAYKELGFHSGGIIKSNETGYIYKGYTFKIVKNEL